MCFEKSYTEFWWTTKHDTSSFTHAVIYILDVAFFISFIAWTSHEHLSSIQTPLYFNLVTSDMTSPLYISGLTEVEAATCRVVTCILLVFMTIFQQCYDRQLFRLEFVHLMMWHLISLQLNR